MKLFQVLALAAVLAVTVDAKRDCKTKTPVPTTTAPPSNSSSAPPASSSPTPTKPGPGPTPTTTAAPSSSTPATTKPGPKPTTAAPGNSTTAPPSGDSDGLGQYLDEKRFKELFPEANALYTYAGLVKAAAKYPKFANTGDATKNKRELAAFLAQTSHECDHYKATEEYAKDTFPETQYCNKDNGVPCAAGKRYHGRGPIQLSWNYNYNAAGKALGVDLLNKPELVSTDPEVTWQTALWYWMTPQREGKIIHDIMGKDDGFAQSTNIINGALECGGPAKDKENQRIQYYKTLCQKLQIEPEAKLSCNA